MRLEAGGRRLEYVWHGPPPDRSVTLVFLHEGLGSVSTWRDFPARVAAAAGCGALVYSRAGYGNSDPIALPRATSFMHEEALLTLPAVLDSVGVREAILVGHSDGGSIALIYAGGTRNARLRGLVLESPHVFVEDLSIESIRRGRRSLSKRAVEAGVEASSRQQCRVRLLGLEQGVARPGVSILEHRRIPAGDKRAGARHSGRAR
jgi:pimeloyl-ACP methyl ester carboxylesterase